MGTPDAGRSRAAVVLRPLGSPLPLGLTGLAISSVVFSGIDLGWIALAQSRDAATVVLIGAVPLQTLACLFALPARDGPTAGTNALLAATWGAYCAVRLGSPPGATSPALGLQLVVAGPLLIGMATAQGLGKPLVAAAVALAGARFAVTGVYELNGAAGWQDAAGALGLAVAAVAAYAVVAFELEDAQDRQVLPTFRRGPGRGSLEGSAASQLEGVEHEAGVRRQL
jgi:succinate-acetate transporter protein